MIYHSLIIFNSNKTHAMNLFETVRNDLGLLTKTMAPGQRPVDQTARWWAAFRDSLRSKPKFCDPKFCVIYLRTVLSKFEEQFMVDLKNVNGFVALFRCGFVLVTWQQFFHLPVVPCRWRQVFISYIFMLFPIRLLGRPDAKKASVCFRVIPAGKCTITVS